MCCLLLATWGDALHSIVTCCAHQRFNESAMGGSNALHHTRVVSHKLGVLRAGVASFDATPISKVICLLVQNGCKFFPWESLPRVRVIAKQCLAFSLGTLYAS